MVSDRQLGGKAYFVGQGEPVLLWDWLNEIFLNSDFLAWKNQSLMEPLIVWAI